MIRTGLRIFVGMWGLLIVLIIFQGKSLIAEFGIEEVRGLWSAVINEYLLYSVIGLAIVEAIEDKK